MTLISRYVLREALGASLAVAAVLFVIFMSSQLADVLRDAAADRLPREAVLSIVTLTSLHYLTQLTPVALFLGVLLALARLTRDSEMAALSACGFGPGRLLVPIGVLAALLAGFTAWLAVVATPAATQRIESIRAAARAAVNLGSVDPGKFMSSDAGRTVFRAAEVHGEELHDVFVLRRQDERLVVVRAARAERVVEPGSGAMSLKLFDGRRYEIVPGDAEFVTVSFGEHGLPIRGGGDDEDEEPVAAKPTAALLRSPAPEDRAELQWRLSMPLSVAVLALLAVPLSGSSPREGRYARLGVGVLIYITYASSLSIARSWLERELVPQVFGLWWVHAVLLLVALLLLARAGGWFVRAPRVGEAPA